MDSISECLNLLNNVVLDKVKKNKIIDDMESVRKFVLTKPIGKNGELENSVLDVLEKVNNIIAKIYEDDLSGVAEEYERLRTLVLIWLDAIYLNLI